jgi:hypothetical protein
MVIGVCHFTDQVEIAGGGHAPIVSLAANSYTSVPLGGYDEPSLFQFLLHLDTNGHRAVELASFRGFTIAGDSRHRRMI